MEKDVSILVRNEVMQIVEITGCAVAVAKEVLEEQGDDVERVDKALIEIWKREKAQEDADKSRSSKHRNITDDKSDEDEAVDSQSELGPLGSERDDSGKTAEVDSEPELPRDNPHILRILVELTEMNSDGRLTDQQASALKASLLHSGRVLSLRRQIDGFLSALPSLSPSSSSSPSSRPSSSRSQSASQSSRQSSARSTAKTVLMPPDISSLRSLLEERNLLLGMQEQLGESFPFFTSQGIRPTNEAVYYLQFGKRKLYFKELDHGMKYGDFLGPQFVPDDELVVGCPSAKETFRCSWLSLGAATGIHPFYLQTRFRVLANEMVSTLTEDNDIWGFGEKLQEVLAVDSFIDINVFNAIWPYELNRYRVMVVVFSDRSRNGLYPYETVSVFTPHESSRGSCGQGRYKDIIMKLQFGHFTLLLPDRRRYPAWGPNPIDHMISVIEEFNEANPGSTIPLEASYRVPYQSDGPEESAGGKSSDTKTGQGEEK